MPGLWNKVKKPPPPGKGRRGLFYAVPCAPWESRYTEKNRTERGAESVKIHGLQKMTLLDWPGRVACTVFLGGCDFRCPFCHNADLLDGALPAELDDGGTAGFSGKAPGPAGRGVRHRRESPCCAPDLEELLRRDQGAGLSGEAGHQRQPSRTGCGALCGAGAGGLCGHGREEQPGAATPRPPACPGWTWPPSGRAWPGCWPGRWTTNSAPRWCGSSTTRRPSRPSARWLAGARRYFLQSFVDRDTRAAARPVPAVTRTELERFAGLVRPFVAVGGSCGACKPAFGEDAKSQPRFLYIATRYCVLQNSIIQYIDACMEKVL